MSSLRYLERGFQGLDTYVAPSEIAPGFLTQCDNLRVDGGDLVTRPGLRGVLTAPHPQPVYGLFAHVVPDPDTGALSTHLLYSSEGKLWRNPISGTPAVPATDSAQITIDGVSALNSPGVMLERAGQYVYGIDGVGPLFRLNADTASAVAGLTAPANALQASLYSHVIDPLNEVDGSGTVKNWSASALGTGATTNQILDSTFASDSIPFTSGDWTAYRIGTGTPALEFFAPADPANPTEKYMRMDDPPSAFGTTNAIANAELREVGAGGAILGTGRYATQFAFSCRYNAQFANDGGVFRMVVYSDAPGGFATAGDSKEIARQTLSFTQGGVSANRTWSGVFDFSNIDTPIKYYRLFVEAGTHNVGGNNGPYFGHFSLNPIDPGIRYTLSGGQVGVVAPDADGAASLAGIRLIKDFGTDIDFSGESHLAIGLTQFANLSGLAGVLGFMTSGGTIVYSNPFTVAADGRSLTVDISTLAPSDRTAVRYLEICLTSDVTVSGSPPVLFALGPLTAAGNLTVGFADYLWLYTEVNDEGDMTLASILESNPAPYSNALTPNDLQAEGQLALPIPAPTVPNNNTAGNVASHFRLYRIGGTVGFVNGASDGLARLVGTWAFSTGGPSVDNPDRLAVYDSTTGIVYDNVPDSELLGETTIADFGRDSAPHEAQAITFFQGRLGLGVGSHFYWSWLVDADGAAGLYFNTFLDPGDPNAAIKGGVFPIGGDDNDPITRFDPFASQLVIEKGRSVWLGVGSDALDLRVQQYLSSQGVGCVAKRGGGKIGNHVWMRGADSLYQFDADTVNDVGMNIERALNPAAQDDAFVYHGRRGFWITRSPGASANDSAWVWDTRTGQYVRFLQFAMTGGVSLAAGENGDGAYFGGLDGQVYHLTGSSDRATPTATPTAIPWAVTTRAFGAETGREVTGTHVLCEVSVQEATTFTLTASEDGGAGRSASVPYSVSGAGEYRLRLRLPPGKARGRALTVTVEGASTLPLRVQAVGLEAVTGARA